MPWYDPVLAPACAAAAAFGEVVHASTEPSQGLQQRPEAWKDGDLLSSAEADVALSMEACTHCQVCTSALCACMQDDSCLWVLLGQRSCDIHVKHLQLVGVVLVKVFNVLLADMCGCVCVCVEGGGRVGGGG